MIDSEVTIKQSPRAAYRKLGEGSGAVILHLDTAEYHGVNEVGSVVWSLLEQEPNMATLIEELRKQLEDEPPNLEQDIAQFLEELRTRDLVVLGDAGAQP
jgi:hypothetical protein